MSTGATQSQLTGDGFPAHLTTEPDHRIGTGLDLDADEGLFYCKDCEIRVTRNSKNFNEYGHARDCGHHQVFSGDSS